MEVSLTKEISKCVESVDSFFIGKLISIGLVCIRHYHSIRLDLSMLRAALEYWDATHHVFRFNQCKLCPMIEEFVALMNNTDFRFFLLSSKPRRALDILVKCLGIPYSLGGLG
jgi:hypothetical protein